MQLSLPLLASEHEPASPTGERRGAVLFLRHRRARRYILRVLGDGSVRVTLPWRGSKREALAFVEKSAGWIARQQARLLRHAPLKPPAETPTVGDTSMWRRAKAELPPQLLALADAHGIRVSRVSIRNQRSRWGACSARGSVTLNWRLLLVPDFVREYVMIHELMHRRELNHSKRFWGHVRAACPRYREARQWLLTEGQRLFS